MSDPSTYLDYVLIFSFIYCFYAIGCNISDWVQSRKPKPWDEFL